LLLHQQPDQHQYCHVVIYRRESDMKKAQRQVGDGFAYEGGRPRDEDTLTRKRLPLWDRVKWLLLLVVIWLLLVWSLMANNPPRWFLDALRFGGPLGGWGFIP